jgi:hypothetical protein
MKKWIAPSAEEVQKLVLRCGGHSVVADGLKKHKVTVYQWCRGDTKVQYSDFVMMQSMDKSK